jgi:hypothetical protein
MNGRRIRIKATLPRLLLIALFEWHFGHFTAWHSSPLAPANTSDALPVARDYFPRMTDTPEISYCEHDLDRRARRYVQVSRILRQHAYGPQHRQYSQRTTSSFDDGKLSIIEKTPYSIAQPTGLEWVTSS